ncbi:MAG: Peptide transporter [Nitrospira sp.]|nr:MAG: Peptide transporter [Nitrospira sp.]
MAVLPVGVSVFALMAAASFGQTIPDAGVLQQREQRQIEQERRESVPGQAPTPAPGTSPNEPAEGAVTVFVSGYRFEGNTLVPEEELRQVVASYADRQVDLVLLQRAAAVVAEHYRQRGWIVRTYLPQQDVTGGNILINIIEAMVGEVSLEGMPPTRVKPEHVLGMVREQLHSDEPLSTKALDRGLLLADDLVGVQSSGALAPGERLGQTNVLVTAKDDPPLQGDLIVNNGGQRATGAMQGIAEVRVESPFKRGDRLSLTGVFSEGSQYGRVGYTRPVGYDGWQIGVNASWLSYRLITPEFTALNVNGDAQSVGIGALYPLIRARNYNLQWLMNYDYRRFNNQALNVTRSNYRINEGTVGFAGNWFEELLGTSGATFGSLNLIVGEVGQGAHDVGENSGIAGTFSKIRWYVSRQQQMISGLSIFGAFTGQKAFSTMDSAEKFYLGGPQGLRAYPVNEASGSTGWLATGELRGSLPWGVGLAGFFDAGWVSNPANSGQSYSLKGGGLTLSWRAPLGITLDATWAHRLGDNPNPTATGQDQDGSLTRNRFWFSVHYAF